VHGGNGQGLGPGERTLCDRSAGSRSRSDAEEALETASALCGGYQSQDGYSSLSSRKARKMATQG